MEKLLTKTGETMRICEMMYKAVVQTVILYRIQSWVVTEVMLKVL